MSIDLPSTKPLISSTYHRRGRPILSGEGAADLVYGIRGISSAANHAYACRVHTLVSIAPYGGVIAETTSTSSVDVTEAMAIEVGEDVSYLRLTIDMEQGYGRISMEDGTGSATATTPGVTTRAIDTVDVALSDTSGPVVLIDVQAIAQSGQAAKIYSILVAEVALVAADIP